MRRGRTPGIYTTWSELLENAGGFSGMKYKGFMTLPEAQDYMAEDHADSDGNDDEDDLPGGGGNDGGNGGSGGGRGGQGGGGDDSDGGSGGNGGGDDGNDGGAGTPPLVLLPGGTADVSLYRKGDPDLTVGEFIICNDSPHEQGWFVAEVLRTVPQQIDVRYYHTPTSFLAEHGEENNDRNLERLNKVTFRKTWVITHGKNHGKATSKPPYPTNEKLRMWEGPIPLAEIHDTVLLRGVQLSAEGTLSSETARLAVLLQAPPAATTTVEREEEKARLAAEQASRPKRDQDRSGRDQGGRDQGGRDQRGRSKQKRDQRDRDQRGRPKQDRRNRPKQVRTSKCKVGLTDAATFALASVVGRRGAGRKAPGDSSRATSQHPTRRRPSARVGASGLDAFLPDVAYDHEELMATTHPTFGALRGYKKDHAAALLLFHHRSGLAREYEDDMSQLQICDVVLPGVKVSSSAACIPTLERTFLLGVCCMILAPFP